LKYISLVQVYEELDSTTKRLEKTYHIAKLLKDTPADSLEVITLLVQGRLFPAWDQTELGVASKLVVKAIELSTGNSKSKVENMWAKTGDLGGVAEQLLKSRRQLSLVQQHLTVEKVVSNLRKIATLEGFRSVDMKLKLIAEMLTCATPLEAKYITRTVLGDLRLGVGEGSLRDAIAWAFFAEDMEGLKSDDQAKRKELSEAVAKIQHAYDVTNDFGEVALLAKKKGLKGLGQVSISPGKPLKVMLAPKVSKIEEGFDRVGSPAEAEFKYDGFRMQVHKKDSKITLFTRRLEDVTKQFPDVVDSIRKHVKGDSFILDSEAVGYDSKTGKYLPFQNISQRIKRKYDIEELASRLPVELNVFDVLYFNGKSMIDLPFSERRAMIEKNVSAVKKRIRVAENIVTKSIEEMSAFYKKALSAGNEGLMLKKLDAVYKPGSRVGYMVKLKPVMDSLDLVIVGAEWGEGKRAKWLTSFTLACVDENGDFLEVGKVGTGIKELEEQGLTFGQLTEMLRPHILKESGREVIVKPKVVVEVMYDEIQKSPTYSSGFALRFPRVIQVRDDRSPKDASTLAQVEDYFFSQNK